MPLTQQNNCSCTMCIQGTGESKTGTHRWIGAIVKEEGGKATELITANCSEIHPGHPLPFGQVQVPSAKEEPWSWMSDDNGHAEPRCLQQMSFTDQHDTHRLVHLQFKSFYDLLININLHTGSYLGLCGGPVPNVLGGPARLPVPRLSHCTLWQARKGS